jgi:hypothetical protein
MRQGGSMTRTFSELKLSSLPFKREETNWIYYIYVLQMKETPNPS